MVMIVEIENVKQPPFLNSIFKDLVTARNIALLLNYAKYYFSGGNIYEC